MENQTTTSRPVLTIKQKNGHVIKSDLETLGPMLAYYRERRGFTRSGLGTQALTMSSEIIRRIEQGEGDIGNRHQALRLVAALELTPLEAEHFLHVAGFATVIDWRQFARDILVDLGLGSLYEEQFDALYEKLLKQQAKAARVPRKRPAHDQ